jgi:ribosomal protein L7/L12
MICYPVDGETFVELWFGDALWAEVQIADVDHDLTGDERVADARFTVTFYEPPGGSPVRGWDFDLADVESLLSKAKAALLANEVGVEPIDNEEMTRADKAFSKIGADSRRAFSIPPATNPDPSQFGTGAVELLLIESGSTPLDLIRALREITGFGYLDARALVDGCPAVIAMGLSEDHAARLRVKLEAVGATVETRPRTTGKR